MRWKLTLAYEGTAFSGWQSQAHGHTVQDELERALAKVHGSEVRIHGAGRTDAGVHALGQVAHFDSEIERSPEVWIRSLNAHLPSTLRILKMQKVDAHFHSRFSATEKIYEYRIWNGSVLSPFLNQRVWHIPQKLDRENLCEAARIFVGQHDFRAFCVKRGDASDEDTVRVLSKVHTSIKGSLILLRFEGPGFLYKMVRMMSAAAVLAGRQRISTDALKHLLREPSFTDSGLPRLVAPAWGLYLLKVRYACRGCATRSRIPSF